MEQQDHRPTDQHPILCAKQCGFFGNPMFQNMCSKCFKEHEKEQQQQPAAAATEEAAAAAAAEAASAAVAAQEPTTVSEPTTAAAVEVKAVESAPAVTQEAVAEPSPSADADQPAAEDDKPAAELPPKQARKDRCYQCKVKLTLAKQISNQCRCGFIYCDSHRHSHECGFDHQQRQQEVLTALNPKVAMKTGGRSFNRLD